MDRTQTDAERGSGALEDTRLRLHWDMLRVRRIEEAIGRAYPEYEMRCPTHFCIGQEAVPVGTSAHLHPGDLVFSGHRSHGHYIAKGGSLQMMLAELYGRETGCAQGRGGSQHLIDLKAGFVASAPILAGTVPIAVGAAWGIRQKLEDRIVVVYFGDGATEEGVFHESMNYAALHNLPVLFVCENNLFSVHSPMEVRQPAGRSIAQIGDGHAVPAETLDGNDIEAVWDRAGAAVRRARAGEGPTLLECITYRWLEHCGPTDDVHLGYRHQAELDDWKEKCPLARSERALRAAALLTDEMTESMDLQIAEEIDAAFSFAKASAFPNPADLAAYTYPDGD